MKERIKCMLETLTSCVENQLTHLDSVDTEEMGEAIDMIKDLEEAMYYCVITKAMEEKYEPKEHYSTYMRDMDRSYGKMYYEEDPNWRMRDEDPMMPHKQHEKMPPQHNEMEGRSPRSRRMYMESKAQHSDKSVQMKELENYIQELTSDIVEMVEGSTAEEKQYLSKRVAALANKIQQIGD